MYNKHFYLWVDVMRVLSFIYRNWKREVSAIIDAVSLYNAQCGRNIAQLAGLGI